MLYSKGYEKRSSEGIGRPIFVVGGGSSVQELNVALAGVGCEVKLGFPRPPQMPFDGDVLAVLHLARLSDLPGHVPGFTGVVFGAYAPDRRRESRRVIATVSPEGDGARFFGAALLGRAAVEEGSHQLELRRALDDGELFTSHTALTPKRTRLCLGTKTNETPDSTSGTT